MFDNPIGFIIYKMRITNRLERTQECNNTHLPWARDLLCHQTLLTKSLTTQYNSKSRKMKINKLRGTPRVQKCPGCLFEMMKSLGYRFPYTHISYGLNDFSCAVNYN